MEMRATMFISATTRAHNSRRHRSPDFRPTPSSRKRSAPSSSAAESTELAATAVTLACPPSEIFWVARTPQVLEFLSAWEPRPATPPPSAPPMTLASAFTSSGAAAPEIQMSFGKMGISIQSMALQKELTGLQVQRREQFRPHSIVLPFLHGGRVGEHGHGLDRISIPASAPNPPISERRAYRLQRVFS